MKKYKPILIAVITVLTLACSFSFSAAAQAGISTEFNSKTGTLFVYGTGELNNLYDIEWSDSDNFSDCEHEAHELCSECYNYRIKHIIIEEGITSINHCFFNIYNLKTLALPESLKEIKGGSFISCDSLKSVTLPESVTVIDNAFNECTSLQWVNIPKGIKTLCGFGKAKLTSLEIPRTVKKLAISCDTLENIYIPETVTEKMLKATGYVNEIY